MPTRSLLFTPLVLALWLHTSNAQEKTVTGLALPPDAAPYAEQVLRIPCNNSANAVTFDFSVSVYQPYCGSNFFNDPLVTFDKALNPQPGAAESWSVADDGVTWTFILHQGLMWSDGTPVTAHDYVATFRFSADPDHAWDFAWYYTFVDKGGIKNWDEVIAGELPVEALGVRAIDDRTLEIITKGIFPPLPKIMKYAYALQKKALAEHGPYYNNEPATAVSSGPFMLESFDHGFKVVFKANPHYKGYRPPRLARIEGIYMSPATYFIAYLNNEIDTINFNDLSPADFATIERDPELLANYLRPGLIGTDYVFFDPHNPPFDNLDVRKAFAHAINREAIVKSIYGEIKAVPAHTMLMPGFPAADITGDLTDYQRFDCGLAKEHLAKAGYPNGADFPPQVMWLRNENPGIAAVYQAAAASISQCLDISIQVSNKDNKVFMDALHERPTKIALGSVAYAIDFADPINLLGIWVSSGRHSWRHQRFDEILDEASNLIGEPARRDSLFHAAERILVDDVGGAFIAHRWAGDLWRPKVRGASIRDPGPNDTYGSHSGNDWQWGDIYIGKAQ
ncbi:MAG: peptide ABC transporter substrate-binding protein [Gemmatimonadetes bacterium]|nr:peptide ABC transporter substrate-binding protein [Gemmatimonadota bacterium]